MPKRDPRIDAYIREAAPFSQPVLRHLRKLIHAACPQAEETVKWGFPHFMYKDRILCGMGAFKAHCTFGFWKGLYLGRITSVKDLPSAKVLAGHVRQAMKLTEAARSPVKAARASARKKPPVKAPADLMRALRASKKALATYEAFSPTHKREYVEWVTGAKTEETRERRLETAVEWMSQGKPRNWKYIKK